MPALPPTVSLHPPPLDAQGQVTRVIVGPAGLLPTPTTLPDEPLPTVPGYDVLRVLGRGGMGVVYEARDQRLKRAAAIKMIGDAALHDDGLAGLVRFRREAEAIARLQHPGIVSIYEVGQTRRPYLVLEYVGGPTLAALLAGGALTPLAAAGLVAALADALSHAHAAGIVHRDLKPANVLLPATYAAHLRGAGPANDNGPKVADFGLAREQGAASDVTDRGVMGTPQYMAPEQTHRDAGEAATAPTVDVYALGAVLYECLTARPPFQGADPVDTLLQVRHLEPVPPSRLAPGLPRNLETVCLKCLEKSPRGRYATAADLAADLRRFLAGEPVRARPLGIPMRVATWARRYPGVSTAGTVAAACLVALGLGGVQYARTLHGSVAALRAEQERGAAERARAEANLEHACQAVNELLAQVGADGPLADFPELEPVRRQLLERSLGFYQQFLTQRTDDQRLRRQAAAAWQSLGRVHRSLGQRAEAEHALVQSADAWATLAAAPAATAADHATWRLVQSELAEVVIEVGSRYAEATALQRAALDGLAALAARTGDPADVVRLADARRRFGKLAIDLQLFPEARRLLADADREAASARATNAAGADRAWVQARLCQGDLLVSTGEYDRLAPTLTPVAAVLDAAVTAKPTDRGLRDDTVRLLKLLGVARQAAGDDPGYRDFLARAVTAAERVADLAPSLPGPRLHLAEALIDCGAASSAVGDNADADQRFRRAVALLDRLCEERPTVTLYRLRLALAHLNFGVLTGTEANLRRAVAITATIAEAEPTLLTAHSQLAYARAMLGSRLMLAGRLAEAEGPLRQGIDAFGALRRDNKADPEIDQNRATALVVLIDLLDRQGRPADALGVHRDLVAAREEQSRRYPANANAAAQHAGSRHNLGRRLYAGGDPAAALAEVERAVTVAEAATRAHPTHGQCREFLANCLGFRAVLMSALGRHADAVAALAPLEALVQATPQYHLKLAYFAAETHDLLRAGPPSPERDQLVGDYRRRWLDSCRTAAQAGHVPAAVLRANYDRPGLRDAAGFRRLLAELEGKPSEPDI